MMGIKFFTIFYIQYEKTVIKMSFLIIFSGKQENLIQLNGYSIFKSIKTQILENI